LGQASKSLIVLLGDRLLYRLVSFHHRELVVSAAFDVE
jgi:hypothetical protein